MQEPFNFVITDQDLGFGKAVIQHNISRVSCHGIVFCKNNESIFMVYHGRTGCYTLPGGGIELGETKEETFKREIEEETGIICTDLRFLGHTEEHKAQTEYFMYCNWFLAREEEQGVKHLCENEVKKRLESFRVPIGQVKTYLESSYQRCDEYRRKFIQYRDLMVWNYFLEYLYKKEDGYTY